MLNVEQFEKENLKVLGLLVRYKRIKSGFSLRELGEKINVSHTLISNFERGILTPHNETIKDLFEVLELKFYDNQEILNNFNNIYNQIFKHILFYEYYEASKLISEIEENREIYENSKEVINFTIIRCLYYVLTNTFVEDKEKILKQYESVLEFFSENQKKMFYFIKGLEELNNEFYKDARLNFEISLKTGDKSIDLIINEYYVITLSKANKYVDSRIIADECIREYEQQTIYVRAMRLRTGIAHDYIRILKFKEAKEIYKYVIDYSIKYKVKDLENICNTNLAKIAILENNYPTAKKYLEKVTPVFSIIYYYIKFDIITHSGSREDLLNYYNRIIDEKWIENRVKTKNFFKLILMKNIDKFMDKKEYANILNKQIKIALESDDGEMLEIASKVLMEFYKNERQYKKAFEVSEIFLHYIRYGAE